MRKVKLYKRIKSWTKRSAVILLAFLFVFNAVSPVFAASSNSVGNEDFRSATTQESSIQNTDPIAGSGQSPEVSDSVSITANESNTVDLATPSTDKAKDNSSDKTKNSSNNDKKAGGETSISSTSTTGGDSENNPLNQTSDNKKNMPKSDTASGALVYDYPIEVPPGRNGMQPNLALTYNSQAADNDSIFGYGWSINIPYIERTNKKGTDKLYSEYYFNSSLSGELVNVSGNLYGAKVENGDFLKYEFSNNNWTVTDKYGKKYKFGLTASSRQDDPNDTTKVFKWMLEETRDLNDNFIRYEYFKDQGQIYPSRIIYTGNAATDGIFTVEFARQIRTDAYTSYKTAFQVKTSYRINEIQTAISGNWARKYAFTYSTGDNTVRSMLSSITESGRGESGNITTLPETSFEYSKSVPGWNFNNTTYRSPVYFANNLQYMQDVNGDGLFDIIESYRENPSWPQKKNVYINSGNNSWVLNPALAPPVLFDDYSVREGYGNVWNEGVRLADVNGDDYVDIVKSLGIFDPYTGQENLVSEAYLNNNGNGWTANNSWAPLIAFESTRITTSRPTYFMNLNGDAFQDIIATWEGKKEQINNNSGFDSVTYNWISSLGLYNPTAPVSKFVDINSDGLTDAVESFVDGLSVEHKNTFINAGNGNWAADGNYRPPMDFGTISSDSGVRFLDVNGDGLVDVVMDPVYDTYPNGTYLNTGNGWIYKPEWNLPIPDYNLNGMYGYPVASAVDLNNDGLIDFFSKTINNGNLPVVAETYLSKGKMPDLLTKITNPKGGFSEVSYKITSQYRDIGNNLLSPNLPVPMNTVYQITTNDGFGNLSDKSYSYEGGEIYFDSANPYDKKFAGFAKVTETDAAGSITKTYYHQGNESNSSQGEFQDNFYKIGRTYRSEISDASGNIYSKTINKWESTDLGSGRSFTKLTQTIDSSYDGGATHKDKAETYDYDNTNGNLTTKIQWGEVAGTDNGTFTDVELDKFTTVTSYASNTTLNILGLPSQETTSDQSANKVKESIYYYDNLALGSVNKGNQTKEEKWKSAAEYVSNQKTYNNYGLVISQIDERNFTTNYSYDPYNLYPATVTNPLNHITQYTYDYSLGKPKQTTDPNGYVFQTVYDGLDRIIEEKQPDSVTPSTLVTKSSYVYTDTAGAVSVKKTDYLDATNSVDAYTYFDGLGRIIQTRKESENANTYLVSDFAYNNIGLLEKESLPYFSPESFRTSRTTSSNLYTNYTYDPIRRILSASDAMGAIHYGYYVWDTVVEDKNGNYKEYYYDAYNRLVAVVEYNGADEYATYYGYDGLNNLTYIQDAGGNVRNIGYDSLGNKIYDEDLHGVGDGTFGAWYFEYDENGNLTGKYDPNGDAIWYWYDGDSRLLGEYSSKGSSQINYGYDDGTNGIGRLTSINSGSYTQTNAYNALGNLIFESKIIDSNTYTTSYAYDRQSNQLTITNPDNSIIRYEYGAGGLLNTVSRKESTNPDYIFVVSNIDYSSAEQPTVISYANGMTTTNTYGPSHLYKLMSKVTTIAGNAYGQNISYGYDNNGNIIYLENSSSNSSSKTVQYAYDRLNRLTSATAYDVASDQTPYTETYTYDAIGNITSKTGQGSYAYAGNTGTNYANPHAVTSIGSTNLTYDRNGNLLTKGDTLSNTWDGNNRMTQSVAGANTITYVYDAAGERIKQSSATTTTTYPTRFYNTDGTAPTKHIFANGIEVGAITGTGLNAVIHYTATDHLTGSNITTDSSNNQEELLDYFPWGTIRIDQKAGSYSDQRKFGGHEYDSDTSLSYMNARYYDSEIGRFISQDPAFLAIGDDNAIKEITGQKLQQLLSDPQALNSYAYARNNPLLYIDEDGRFFGQFGIDMSNNQRGVANAFYGLSNYFRSQGYIGYGAGFASDTIAGVANNIANIWDPRESGSSRAFAIGMATLDVGSGGKGKSVSGLIPNSNNYRTIFQKTFGELSKDIQVHHTLPQKYENLFKEVRMNINEMKYLEAVSKDVHRDITNAWRSWDKAQNGNITVQKVQNFAGEIKKEFGKYFVPKN